MIRKFSRKSSPYCAVCLEHIQGNERLQADPHLWKGEKTEVLEITDRNPQEVDPHLEIAGAKIPHYEATGQSGSAGVKIRQQIAFVEKRQGPGDEGRGALRSGSFCGSD